MGWGADQIAALVQDAGHRLTPHVLAATREAFAGPALREAMEHAGPEFERDEFLLNVDQGGRPTEVSARDTADTQRTIAAYPAYARWFRVEAGQLLVARWLCHLVGLRHRTVHLMLDHPLLPGHLIVQVRSLSKHEAPGCFDLPVAGHVTGVETPERALATECKEELALSRECLAGLRQIGAHEQALLPTPSGFSDVEYQMVYRARLTRAGWLHASAADHEVAAIAAFSRSDLAAMLREHPDRVAPGLTAALSRYEDL